jgi:hypothetical protein
VGVYPQPLIRIAQELLGPLASAAAIALK